MLNSKNDSNGKIVVLSDLHLWGPEDPLYRALLKFIDSKLSYGDKFFIVGDLFDLFIGGKSVFIERYYELIAKIRDLAAKKIEVFYIEGNHDFHLENIFDDCAHVRLYADSLHYEWNGRKLYFCHGDKLNWKDVGYQAFRLLTRNLVSQCIIEATPGTIIDRVGRMMSKASRGYHVEPNDDVVRLFRNHACELIASGYDFVVMGHSHYMDDMRFRINGHEGQYVNVGYPRKHKRYLELAGEDCFFKMSSWDEVVSPLRPLKSVEQD
ncbi:MAG: UDP-2,3-diacylglucosamine diphosphatase [Bdellovibrionota bacterium]